MLIKNLRTILALAVSITSTSALAATAEEIDDPREAIEVPVTEVLDSSPFADTGYKLDPVVTVYRGRAFYELSGPDGTEVVVSTRQLRTRLQEINAVATLDAMKKTDVYVDALKSAGMAPVELGKGLVTKPVDTVSRVGRGIGGFFADVGYSITGDDPDQENAAKTALGWGAAKRSFAFELGVNPYSENQRLQDALGEVSWTTVGGNLTVSAGFRAVNDVPGKVLSLSKMANGMRKLTKDKSPRELKNLNDDKLKAMGITESLRDAFLSNQDFDPETETRLVGALESMAKTAGREGFVQRAALTETKADARMMRDWAELMAAYNESVRPATEIVMVGAAPNLVVADGSVQTVYPADFVVVTAPMRLRLQMVADSLKEKGLKLGEVWITGKATPEAEDMVLEQGWQSLETEVEQELFTE